MQNFSALVRQVCKKPVCIVDCNSQCTYSRTTPEIGPSMSCYQSYCGPLLFNRQLWSCLQFNKKYEHSLCTLACYMSADMNAKHCLHDTTWHDEIRLKIGCVLVYCNVHNMYYVYYEGNAIYWRVNVRWWGTLWRISESLCPLFLFLPHKFGMTSQTTFDSVKLFQHSRNYKDSLF